MTLMMALDDVDLKTSRIRKPSRDLKSAFTRTTFIGSRENPDSPYANFVQLDPGFFTPPHFHICDQFQVVVDGRGTLGRHGLSPYGLHFTRAYTPYGPLISDADIGLTYFAIRAHAETGAQYLPEKRDQLGQVSHRQPWQITSPVNFPTLSSLTAATMVQTLPKIKDENGLAAFTLSMQANTQTFTPDPSHTEGQYLIVFKGSLMRDGTEKKALALVFVYPHEGPLQVHAGPQGLQALVLNFPKLKPRAIEPKTPSAGAGFKKWQCTLCSFAYDEALGLPEEGIPPGTRWENVPDSWSCGDCGAAKSDFAMVEI